MMNSKRGSAAVFLAFIIAVITGLTAMFIYAARQSAYSSIGDGALNMGMRSILSEFDIELKERYGLMAFEKNGMETALEINDYIDYTFNDENPVKKIKVSFGEYALSNVPTLKQQIIEYMELTAAEKILSDSPDSERNGFKDRTLRNRAVIETLPSKAFAGENYSFLDKLELWKDKIETVEDIFENPSKTLLIDMYITDNFKYAAGGPVEDKTFFDHEVEYIIAGDFSNKKNRENVERGLKVLRTGLNAAYIYSDETKMAQTLAAAELLTPSAAAATQAVLITTWAAAEADNDVELLLKGKPVSLMKNENCWATDLDNVLENITEDCIDTGNQKGLYYRDYMLIFLHFQDENIKLARIADLIQINMKASYDRDFLMKTVNGGFRLDAEIYGKEMGYETRY